MCACVYVCLGVCSHAGVVFLHSPTQLQPAKCSFLCTASVLLFNVLLADLTLHDEKNFYDENYWKMKGIKIRMKLHGNGEMCGSA